MPGVLLSGYYGFGNCGDEAVLEAAVGLLRARRPELPVAALSADPAGTAARCGIRAYRRAAPREVIGAIRGAELVLSGGGSLLQDRTSLRSLLYYLAVIQLALALGRRVMVFAQGIGPLTRPAARRLTARLLGRVHGIAVRDADSRALLLSLEPRLEKTPGIEVTADPAFALPPVASERVAELLRAARAGGRALVAANLRPWPGMEVAAEAVAAGLRALGPEVATLGCPFQPEEDGPPCRALVERLGAGALLAGEPLRPGEWLALLGGADVVLAARLHALIFAAAAARPAVAISYDPKVASLQARVGQPDLGPPERLTPEPVTAAVRQCLAAGPVESEGRQARAEELRRAAGRNADLALALLGRG